MAKSKQIYITDEVKTKLDRAAALDKRPLVDEIDYLVDERLKAIALMGQQAAQQPAQQANGDQDDS